MRSRGNAHELGFLAGGGGQQFDEFGLGERARVGDVEGVADRGGRLRGLEHGRDQVLHIDELHQAAAVAGQDQWPLVAHAVPEELLAVEGIGRAVDEGRTQGHHGQAKALMELEQSAFALGLVAGVAVGPVVGGQGVALVVIEAVAVGRDAGHENVAADVAAQLLAERVDDARRACRAPSRRRCRKARRSPCRPGRASSAPGRCGRPAGSPPSCRTRGPACGAGRSPHAPA